MDDATAALSTVLNALQLLVFHVLVATLSTPTVSASFSVNYPVLLASIISQDSAHLARLGHTDQVTHAS